MFLPHKIWWGIKATALTTLAQQYGELAIGDSFLVWIINKDDDKIFTLTANTDVTVRTDTVTACSFATKTPVIFYYAGGVSWVCF